MRAGAINIALENAPSVVWWIFSILWLVVLGLVDTWTGPDVSLVAFYAVPVAALTWFVGGRSGCLVSGLTTAVGMLAFYLDSTAPHAIGSIVWNSVISFIALASLSAGIWQLKTAYLHERGLARIDPLTSIGNLRQFQESAFLELERARRFGIQISIAFIDIDNFKALNDTHGHAYGDRALKVVASALTEAIRSVDLAVRLGGDEFAILFPGTDEAGARIAMDKVHATITRRLLHQRLDTSVSIGVVSFLTPPDDVMTMLHEADQVMYAVKSSTKNGMLLKTIGGASG